MKDPEPRCPRKYRVWDKTRNHWSCNVVVDGDGILWWMFGFTVEVINNPDDYIVMGATGLRDKNDVMIWEKDIVKMTWDASFDVDCPPFTVAQEGEAVEVVEFKDGCFVAGNEIIGIATDGSMEIEVIGNVHENPEMMGGGES